MIDLNLEEKLLIENKDRDSLLEEIDEYLRETPPPRINLIYPPNLYDDLIYISKNIKKKFANIVDYLKIKL